MTTRKLQGPLGGDYQTDGEGNAVLLNTYPLTGEDDIPTRLADHEARVTAAEGVQTSRGRGLFEPNPGILNLSPTPTVMSSPPTVTIGTANASSVISNSVLVPWTSSAFRYLGGTPVQAGVAFPDTLMGRYRTITSSVIPAYMNVEFEFDGSEFEIYQKALASNNYRIWVDGQKVTDAVQSGPGSPGSLFLTHVNFGSRANRRIRIEGSVFYFGGIQVGPNDTIWKPSTPAGPRVALVSDSFGEGAGTGGAGAHECFLNVMGRLLGWRDLWNQSVGGTGYLNNGGGGGKVKYRDRIQNDVIQYNPDIVIVHGSVNDAGQTPSALTAEATALYQAIRAGLPDATLIVVLPFAMLVTATYDAERDAVKAAADAEADFVINPRADGWITGTGRVGATTGSGNADLYRSSDAIHPTAAGSAYLGFRLAQTIAAAMPILGSSS